MYEIDLSVVTVSWNVRELLHRCLASLTHGTAPSPQGLFPLPGERTLQILVVDNASSDGSAEMVRQSFPGVQVLASANRGFAAGNNAGIAASRGRYVLLLNPDTEVAGDALTTLLDYMDAHPDVGVAGPQLRYPDGRRQPSRRRFPTPLTGFWESTLLQRCFPRNRWAARYYVLDQPDDAEADVDWLVGAALLVRREAIAQAGLLDEGYFMYSEEMEWCRRIRMQGWRVVYQPAAVVIHHEGRSSEQVVAARHLYFQTSKLRYYRQVHGPLWTAALRGFLLATYTYDWAIEGAKWLVGHKRPLRAARLAAYGQVLRSGLPPAAGAAVGAVPEPPPVREPLEPPQGGRP
ncbi:MAG TPA: glycosyltransferase family 2 protein [Anaerolineae bacterium]|nr:glycosyltransferase family 2 protein [Anaerolineae bacterium]HOR00229.1 glycosyltransferase family 2 protein [Anaerolineae bacterium]HPL27492.1 glycosyltransferase family 2 protein [Anaerolineae bacterium]